MIRQVSGGGVVKRTPQDEARIRVRLLDETHASDAIDRCRAEMGNRGTQLGPVDLSRNALSSYCDRLGLAYRIPPLVTGLGEDLARAIGDASATVTIEDYASAGGRPMPTTMQGASAKALRYRLGCNWVGMAVGWSERAKRPYLQVITPDLLDVTYTSDDPSSPTVIRWYRTLPDGTQGADVSDLTDMENPIYRVEAKDGSSWVDVSDRFGGRLEGDAYFWRYDDGRPFHRVVISGDPLSPYRNLRLVEGSLRLISGYTGWWAGMRDAAYPRMHTIGLILLGASTVDGVQGQESGPEMVHRWAHENPDRPGSIIQLGPGYDPEVTGRALRDYEIGLLAASGLPVAWESTGGDPSERDRQDLDEIVQGTYTDCRGQDVLLLRRLAAVCNRAGDAAEDRGGERPYPVMPEGGYGVLYREEVRRALRTDEDTTDDEDTDAEPTEDEAPRAG
jgi:hypothetical protein